MRNTSLGRFCQVFGGLALLPATLATAQSPRLAEPFLPASNVTTLPAAAATQAYAGPVPLRATYIGAGFGVIALASLLDERVRNDVQDHRSSGKDDVAKVFRRMGQPEVYATIGLGTLATGLISGNDRITRAGGRITASLLTAGLVGSGLKLAVGRRRPDAGVEPGSFRPFSGRDSWPSGHATMAFALATSVSDEIHSTPVTIGLYGAATLTAWSRVNDNRHWVSDVLSGAAVGFTSAKLMNGHWRIFGLTAPRFLLEPGAVGVSAQF